MGSIPTASSGKEVFHPGRKLQWFSLLNLSTFYRVFNGSDHFYTSLWPRRLGSHSLCFDSKSTIFINLFISLNQTLIKHQNYDPACCLLLGAKGLSGLVWQVNLWTVSSRTAWYCCVYDAGSGLTFGVEWRVMCFGVGLVCVFRERGHVEWRCVGRVDQVESVAVNCTVDLPQYSVWGS